MAAPNSRGERIMKYMLMMHAPRGTGDYQISNWSPDDFKAHVSFMHRLNKELSEAGELVGGEGLAAPGEAKVVRAGKNGVPTPTRASGGTTGSRPCAGICSRRPATTRAPWRTTAPRPSARRAFRSGITSTPSTRGSPP